jgi:hypothetical protein
LEQSSLSRWCAPARPAAAASSSLMYIYARCVLCSSSFIPYVHTGKTKCACTQQQPVASDQPSLADSIFKSPLFVFPQNFSRKYSVNFLSRALLASPIHVHQKSDQRDDKESGGAARLLRRNPKPNLYDSALRLTVRKGI